MIQLPKDLVLRADEYCYIVGRLRHRPDRGMVIDHPTYHPSAAKAVQAALDRIMRLSVEDGSITTLRQFIEEQAKLQLELQQLIAPLDSGQAPQRAAEGHDAPETGKDIPQPSDP